MIFTIRDSCLVPSPCNAHNHMITLAHVQIALLFEIYKSSKYDGQQQYVQSLSNNEKSRSFVFWIFFCVPWSSRRKSTNAMLGWCNSRVLCPQIPCCPSYIPTKLIDSPKLCFNRTIQVWPFLLLCTTGIFNCCATSPRDAPTYIQRTKQ